jgi:hypothetical protein
MPKDWKSLAAALAPDIPAEQLEKITPGLNALEDHFRPLVAAVQLESEPAYLLLVEENS